MKDTQIHEGLENETLRAAICTGLLLSFHDKMPKLPELVYPKGDTEGCILWGIEAMRRDILVKQFDIDKSVRQLAYVRMMKEMGWSEHDACEYIGKSGEYYRNFIGTEEEFNNLIAKLKD